MKVLWAGGARYHGHYYDYECGRDDIVSVARPARGRIPVWVVGVWPRPRSMRRVLRCDGVVPQYQLGDRDATPDDVRALRAWLAEHGAPDDLDVTTEGETPIDDRAAAWAQVEPWAAAGCTWWLETRWAMPHHTEERMREIERRLAAGPPSEQP